MDMITLSKTFGKFSAGTELKVIKKTSSNYIVEKPSGGRGIIPLSFVEGEAETASVKPDQKQIVELTQVQYDVYEALKKKHESDTAVINLNDIASDYAIATGLDQDKALTDVEFIHKKIGEGSIFTNMDAVTGDTPFGGMSDEDMRGMSEWLSSGKVPECMKVPSYVESEEETTAPTLGANQIWFTDITKGRLPKSGINHIVTQYDPEHFEEDIRVDIPEVKADHYWDTEVLECLVLAHKLREKALITGLPGTGKSSSVEQFSAWIRQPYMRLGGRGDLESATLLGHSWVDVEEVNGEHHQKMTFKAGLLTQGVQKGYLVTIDEVMKIPSYIQMAMQHLYEKDGYLTVDDMPGTKRDKVVHPAIEFLMILTDNVKGTGDNFDKFSATQIQDTSTLDRISLNESLDYLPFDDEVAMLRNKFPSISKVTIEKLVKFAGLVRNGYKNGDVALTLSPRGLISILDQNNIGIPILRAIDLAFMNKIADPTEELACLDMIKTVGLNKTKGARGSAKY